MDSYTQYDPPYQGGLATTGIKQEPGTSSFYPQQNGSQMANGALSTYPLQSHSASDLESTDSLFRDLIQNLKKEHESGVQVGQFGEADPLLDNILNQLPLDNSMPLQQAPTGAVNGFGQRQESLFAGSANPFSTPEALRPVNNGSSQYFPPLGAPSVPYGTMTFPQVPLPGDPGYMNANPSAGLDGQNISSSPCMSNSLHSSAAMHEAVGSVNSMEALDNLMSLVQKQSDAMKATNMNMVALQTPLPQSLNTADRPDATDSTSPPIQQLGGLISSETTTQASSSGGSHSAISSTSSKYPGGRTAQLTEPHVMKSQAAAAAEKAGPATNPFHIDTAQLAAVPVNEQSAELQELGLTVYNQDDLEQGIMAQVDRVLVQKEEERMKKILEKELKAVNDDLRTVKQEISTCSKIESTLGPQINLGNRESKRKLDAVQKKKENKLKQLRKLRAKHKVLTQKLTGNSEAAGSDVEELLSGDGDVALEQALGLGTGAKETETERMIRQGEMTPFGTRMAFPSNRQGATPASAAGADEAGGRRPSGPRLAADGQMTDFEKYLVDQQRKGSSKKKGQQAPSGKKKVAPPAAAAGGPRDLMNGQQTDSAGGGEGDRPRKKGSTDNKRDKKLKLHKSQSEPVFSPSRPEEEGPRNFFDARDKRRYRPSERDFSNYRSGRMRFPRFRHNFSEDRRLSDTEEYEDDDVYGNRDDDWVPGGDDIINSDDDYDDGAVPQSGTGGKFPRRRKHPLGRNSSMTGRTGKLHVSIGADDVYSDLEGDSSPKKKARKSSDGSAAGGAEKRMRDDGDYESFCRRIKSWKKERLKRKQEKAEAEEPDSSDSEFEDVEVDDDFKVPAKVWNKLYQYQKTCVKWLYELHTQQAGGIVGDEMGLGKTIQLISFLVGLRVSRLRDKGAQTRYVGLGPTLIVCPATVMYQWVREFHRWWPPFRVAVLHGSGSSCSTAAELVDEMASRHGILVTSYSTLTINQDILLQYDWHYVVLDEGHKIRNPDAQVTIAAKRFRTCHRLILSGSPVQNNLKELWSLFDFIFPGKLGTLPDFMAHFSVPIVQGGYSSATQVQVQTAYKCACVLRDTINPYLLRRMKSDVRHNLTLPDKNEQVLFCRLTEDQREVYNEYLGSRECEMILKGDFMVFPGLITLRKICNHPDLSTGGPQEFQLAERSLGESEEERSYGFWKRSGKMVVVKSLLQLWRRQGHRVLLFTQSCQMLDILELFVTSQGYTYLRMDGGSTISARQPLINKFNQDTSYFLFLLTTRVGGLGVNLTGANRIVLYDPDWNPSTDMQARERAWRIGQKRQVTIYRLLTAGTIEEKIYHRQIFKQFLTNRVLKDPKQRRFFKANDLFELFTLSDVDHSGTTETSAIFAGTGSDVKVASRAAKRCNGATSDPKKPNRFDVLLAKRQKAKEAGTVDVTEEGGGGDDDEEDAAAIPVAKDLVLPGRKKLSRKGSESKNRQVNGLRTDAAAGMSSGKSKEDVKEMSNDSACTNDVTKSKEQVRADDQMESGEGSGSQPGKARSELDEAKMRKMKELAKRLSQQFGKSKGETEASKPSTSTAESHSVKTGGDVQEKRKRDSANISHLSSKSDEKNQKDKHQSKKGSKDEKRKHKSKHKKKKRKDAMFEGERIDHLAKLEIFNEPSSKEEDQNSAADQDNYVLAKLLKKSGVHSAMQHDKIMMSSEPDYALVEGEAERVAKEAAQALRRSRQQCHSARSGIPTWTGSTGSVGAAAGAAPAKPRFGQKKNSKLMPSAAAATPPPPPPAAAAGSSSKSSSPKSSAVDKKPDVTSPSKMKHFDGTMAGNVKTATGAPPAMMTSSQLLSRMKARNSLSSSTAEVSEDAPAGSSTVSEDLDEASLDLITDIRNFVAFMAHVDGQASTREIVDYFRPRVPHAESATFRAMLRQVCEMNKRDGVGIWCLKPEFR